MRSGVKRRLTEQAADKPKMVKKAMGRTKDRMNATRSRRSERKPVCTMVAIMRAIMSGVPFQ
jgi:hypothetical protein